MNTDKIWIRDIAEICAAKGVTKAVIAPGSRSAPLVVAFSRHPAIETIPIIDERVAAFFALGIAQQTGKPVAIICTSGSAPLNFAPAIAEAYYQRIPLLVLTADRPDELIDQRDGQTIRQNNLYQNYIRKSFQLPVSGDNEDDRWYSGRMISEAINASLMPMPGPVHINIPLREPLYQLTEAENYVPPRVIEQVPMNQNLDDYQKEALKKSWSAYQNKMLIVAATKVNADFVAAIHQLKDDPSLVILTEATSNLPTSGVIPCIDPALEAIPKDDRDSFKPELVITIGGEIVSKKIKAYLRKHRPLEHWHIDKSNTHVDTFKCLTKVIGMNAGDFLNNMSEVPATPSGFRKKWMAAYDASRKIRETLLANSPWCDLTVMHTLLKSIPDGSNLHLGNSTPVRYACLFEMNAAVSVNCNRGTSGIDGMLSTASGAAFASGKLTVLITGDIGFFYDSNGLWNKHLPKNLRIILINNSGGNIFRIIPGPRALDELEEYFETVQEQSAEYIAKAYSVDYYFCDEMLQLKEHLKNFYNTGNKTALLEIKTPNKISAEVLQCYMNM